MDIFINTVIVQGAFALPGYQAMPNITRFLLICAGIGGLIYAGLYSLATMLEPAPRDTIVIVPPSRHAK